MRSGLTSTFDSSIRVQDDLFGFVNNQWVQATQIPDDRARYGAFDALREASEAAVRDIVEKAAASDAAAGDMFGFAVSVSGTAAVAAAEAAPGVACHLRPLNVSSRDLWPSLGGGCIEYRQHIVNAAKCLEL